MKPKFKVGDIYYHKETPDITFMVLRIESNRYVSKPLTDSRDEVITHFSYHDTDNHNPVILDMISMKKKVFKKELEKILASAND